MYLPILIHMLFSFCYCYLILFEEKLLGSWSWLTHKRAKYISYILKEQTGMGLTAPHSDWKRIITYYSFLDPWRTSEASLMLYCSFLVPINRKHAPNSLPQGKTTVLLCHKHFWLFGGCREDLRVFQWWWALWGRSWSYCLDVDGEIGHMRVLQHKSIWNKPLCALLLIEKYT